MCLIFLHFITQSFVSCTINNFPLPFSNITLYVNSHSSPAMYCFYHLLHVLECVGATIAHCIYWYRCAASGIFDKDNKLIHVYSFQESRSGMRPSGSKKGILCYTTYIYTRSLCSLGTAKSECSEWYNILLILKILSSVPNFCRVRVRLYRNYVSCRKVIFYCWSLQINYTFDENYNHLIYENRESHMSKTATVHFIH